MALDTLTLKELQQKRQSVKNHLANIKGPEAEVVKTELDDVEDMIRIRQDSSRLQRATPAEALLRTAPENGNPPEKIYFFLKQNTGQAVCDDCAARETGVDLATVNTIAGTLALFPAEFRRMAMRCSRDCSHLEKVCTQARQV